MRLTLYVHPRKPNKLTAWGRATLLWAVFRCQIDGRFAEWRPGRATLAL